MPERNPQPPNQVVSPGHGVFALGRLNSIASSGPSLFPLLAQSPATKQACTIAAENAAY